MIRPATTICLLIFVASGMYAYQTKHRSKLLEIEIEATEKATSRARGKMRDLQTAYSELNDPGRLQLLAEQHMPQLKPAAPHQYASLADLGRRLPPPGPLRSVEPPPEPEPAAVPPAAPPVPVPVPVPAPALAAAAPARPVAPVARAAPAPPPTPLAPTSVLAAAPTRPVPPRPTPAAAPVRAVPLASPAALASARAPEPAPRTQQQEEIRRIARGAPVDPSVPAVASALGMARSLMSPGTPVGTANAAMRGTQGP